MKQTTLLITGATGFVGGKACAYFAQKDYSITGLDRIPLPENKKVKGMTYLQEDIRDRQMLLKATKGVDFVLHFAAAKADERDSNEINVLGARNLLSACKKNKIKAIIFTSTLATQIEHKGQYGKTKLAAEELFLKSKIPVIIFRPSVIYSDKIHGVFGTLVKATKFPMVPVIGDGNTLFYPIFLDDFCNIIDTILIKGIKKTAIYDLCGKDKITYNDLVKKIAAAQNKHIILIHIPVPVCLGLASILSLFFYKPPLSKSSILGSIQNVNPDINKIYKKYDIRTRSFNDGLNEIFSNNLKTEAYILFKYITSTSPEKISISDELIDRYIRAVENNGISKLLPGIIFKFPFLLGPADVMSKLFAKESLLQKKLYLAAALFECDPVSAGWLLPKDNSYTHIFFTLGIAGMRFTAKFLSGIFCNLIPGFIEIYER